MRDPVLVVVVVHDGHLVVAKELRGPRSRKFAQGGKVYVVVGVGRDDEVLVGAGAPALVWLVVAASDPRGVHLVGPLHGILHRLVVAFHIALVPRQIEEVAARARLRFSRYDLPSGGWYAPISPSLSASLTTHQSSALKFPNPVLDVVLADPHILQVTVGALELLDEVVDVVATAAGEERDDVQRVHGLVVVMAPTYEFAVYLRHGRGV